MEDFFTVNTGLGLALGLILGVIANYLFEGLGFKTQAAKLSKRRSGRRADELEQRLAKLRVFRRDYTAFIVYLGGRLVLINALWIAQSAFDYLIGLVGNATYGLSLFGRTLALSVSDDVINTSIYATGSLLGVLMLTIIFNVAYRTYLTWRRVSDFEAYEQRIEVEINELKQVLTAST